MHPSFVAPFSVDSLPGGMAVQIIDYIHLDDGIVPKIDVNTIIRVIRECSAEQLPIYVIGIAGVCRSGKSFFLNLLLHYLQWKQRRGVSSQNFYD